MYSLIAILFALTVKTDLREPAHLYQGNGTLVQNQDVRPYPSFSPKKDLPIKVEIKGDGHGDLDCYLLRRNPQGQGWVVAAKDESNLDQCSFNFTPTSDAPIKLWVINHGVHPTTYTAVVNQ